MEDPLENASPEFLKALLYGSDEVLEVPMKASSGNLFVNF